MDSPPFAETIQIHGIRGVFSAVGLLDGDDASPKSLIRLNAMLCRMIQSSDMSQRRATQAASEKARAKRDLFELRAVTYKQLNPNAKSFAVACYLRENYYPDRSVRTLQDRLKGLNPSGEG